MTSVYIVRNDEILLLYRRVSRVLNDLWIGSAGCWVLDLHTGKKDTAS